MPNSASIESFEVGHSNVVEESITQPALGQAVEQQQHPEIDALHQMIEDLKNQLDRFNCRICLEVASESAVTMRCGHLFCRSCLSRLQKQICPGCRKVFKKKDVIKMHL